MAEIPQHKKPQAANGTAGSAPQTGAPDKAKSAAAAQAGTQQRPRQGQAAPQSRTNAAQQTGNRRTAQAAPQNSAPAGTQAPQPSAAVGRAQAPHKAAAPQGKAGAAQPNRTGGNAVQSAAPQNRTNAAQAGNRRTAQAAPQNSAPAGTQAPQPSAAVGRAQAPHKAAAAQGKAGAAQPNRTASAAQSNRAQPPQPQSGQPEQATAGKDTPAQQPAAPNRAAAANNTSRRKKAQLTAESPTASAGGDPKPAKRAKRGKRGKPVLSQTATLQLEQIARGLQRGANDAALADLNVSEGIPLRLFYNAIGQLLYRIGLQAEYAALRLWRGVRRAAHLLVLGALLLVRTFLRPIGALFIGIWRDLTAPFLYLASGLRNMNTAVRDAKKQGENGFQAGLAYFKRGLLAYRHIGLAAISYVLPLSAAAVLALTVWSVLRTPYSLAITYNDKMIGYVESENTWEEAQKKVLSRIQASNTDETFDARPVFNVVAVDVAARRNAGELANVIISESSDKIQEATGLYVGSTLAGVCSDSAEIQHLLDTTIVSAQPLDDPTARVEFVNSITLDSGLYYTASISNLAQLESTLQANNWLQTKTIRVETTENVVIDFETVEEENDAYYKGTTRTTQRGVNGLKNVTDEVTYIDGVEVSRVTLSEEIIKDATPKIVQIGTKENAYGTGSYNGAVQQGSGALGWPVPNYSYTTTEFGQGNHRGIDICAPYGTPVYACDGGTVIESGWHWSWGYYVLIDHGNGITTRYAHNSTLLVSAGMNVSKGQNIALMGSTGTSSGNHCHLEVTVNGGLVNPRNFIIQP